MASTISQTKQDAIDNAGRRLTRAGAVIHTSNGGVHMQLQTRNGMVDLWPTTGKWYIRDLKQRGLGLNALMKELKMLNRVPNMDAMEKKDLSAFFIKHEKGRNYKELFPLGGEGTIKATRDLANYAINKVTAIGLRLAGNIAEAQKYEEICEDIYETLPVWANW